MRSTITIIDTKTPGGIDGRHGQRVHLNAVVVYQKDLASVALCRMGTYNETCIIVCAVLNGFSSPEV